MPAPVIPAGYSNGGNTGDRNPSVYIEPPIEPTHARE